MRTRLLLVMMVMLTAACRLSDRQHVGVGVLKFAATTITSAATTPNNAAAIVVPTVKQKTSTMKCAERRLQRFHSRVQRVMTRVIRFEVFAAERPCPKARQSAVRS
jgi:hypothetical protein